jgi:hypothetical protein
MKCFLLQAKNIKFSLLLTVISGIMLLAAGCKKAEPPKPVLSISTFAKGLINPIGLEMDKAGRIWVAQGGSGHNDGKVSVITQDGKIYDAIINFESVNDDSGEIDGPTHLLFSNGLLYILGRNGKMYKADESAFKVGNTAVDASSLAAEDIRTFVLAQKWAHPTNDSHPYNLTEGANGAIYITDAGANAVIRRDKTGILSVVTEVPGIKNPTPVGPPQIESVPTGIIYDGQNFLVTTLLGFPFPAGKAIVYKVSPAGAIAVYQQGFTSLVDIQQGGSMGRLVLEHGTFGAMGFAPNTGRLLWADGVTATLLADKLNLPVGLKQADDHTWYVTSLGDGSVLKVKY